MAGGTHRFTDLEMMFRSSRMKSHTIQCAASLGCLFAGEQERGVRLPKSDMRSIQLRKTTSEEALNQDGLGNVVVKRVV